MGRLGSPRNEAWWERELLRNEKRAAEYYNRMKEARRRGEWPGPRTPPPVGLDPMTAPDDFVVEDDSAFLPEFHEDEDSGYRALSAAAMEFSVAVMRRNDYPEGFDEFRNAALRVTTHLAGGHGIGYDDDALCGNIVKCRWALADARFCRETLEALVNRHDRPEFAGLLVRCLDLIPAIKARIEALRERVWW